MNLNTIMENC